MAHGSRRIGAVVLIATGLVWIGQGIGLLGGGSFMVGDARWAWIGLACVAGGVVLGWIGLRSPRR